IGCEKARQIPRELQHAGLGRTVARRVGKLLAVVDAIVRSDVTVHRGDVENDSATLAESRIRNFHHPEHRAQAHVDVVHPILLVNALPGVLLPGPRIVDENVQSSELAHRGLDTLGHGAAIEHIQAFSHDTALAPVFGRELLGSRGALRAIAAGNDDVRTQLSQGAADFDAEVTGTAAYNGRAATERHQLEDSPAQRLAPTGVRVL